MDNLNVERHKAYTIMETHAYTGAARIPMALDDARQEQQIEGK